MNQLHCRCVWRKPCDRFPLISIALVAGLLSLPADTATGQHLRLSASVGKEVFFEGEPIYGFFELRNEGSDTAWVGIFGFGPDRLAISLHRSNGSSLAVTRMWVNYAIPPGWRGTPVAPGERKHVMMVLQNMLGDPVQPNWTVFPNQIPPGSYTLSAAFNAAIPGRSGTDPVLAADPVRIEVRPRTPQEERSFIEVERTMAQGWNRSTRAGYFPRLLAVIKARLVSDSADPFAAFLVNDAIMTGRAWGLTLEAREAIQLTAARLAVARAQRSRPSGAIAALALVGEPTPMTNLVDVLGPSMAADVVRAHEKVKRTPSLQPGRRN